MDGGDQPEGTSYPWEEEDWGGGHGNKEEGENQKQTGVLMESGEWNRTTTTTTTTISSQEKEGRERRGPQTDEGRSFSSPNKKQKLGHDDDNNNNDSASRSFLLGLLEGVGCSLRSQDTGDKCDDLCAPSTSSVFVVEDIRDFRTSFELKLLREPQARKQFLQELEEILGAPEEESMRKLLKPMVSHGDSSNNVNSSQQEYFDSLAHCLLDTYCIQNPVSDLLLEKLAQLDATDKEQKDLMKLILSQFRWLDVNSEENTILDKLMEIICVTDESFQKDVILFLPEITVTDDQAEKVGLFLLQKMEEDSSYTNSVIECIPSLCISDAVRDQITRKMLDQFHAVDVDEVAKLVKFLIESCTAATCDPIFATLRSGLHFVDLGDPRRRLPDRKQKGKKDNETEQAIILAVRSALRCQSEAITMYHKFLRTLDSASKCCTFDVWLITVLLSFGGDYAAQAKQTVNKKILSRQFSVETCTDAIRNHYKPLKEYFGTLLAFTSGLLKSKHNRMSETGVALYSLLFETFHEMYHRQDILGEIVVHLGSGNMAEMDSGLAALSEICRKDLKLLRPFTSYLATLLDHVDIFNNSQTRKLFWVISELISPEANSSLADQQHSRLEDEVHILIRKQMSSNCTNHFQTGVIASLALIEKRERSIPLSDDPPRAVREVCHMFKHMLRECYRNPLILSFCLEEVVNSLNMGSLSHENVLQYINEMVTQDFENTFLEDLVNGVLIEEQEVKKREQKQDHLSFETWFNLDGQDSPVAIKILPFSSSCDKNEQLQLSKLPLQICIMQMLERKLNKSLQGIDALLGCPLHLFSKESLNAVSSASSNDKNVLAQTLISAVNWLREVLNAFTEDLAFGGESSSDTDMDTVEKVIERVKHLHVFEMCLVVLRQKTTEKRKLGKQTQGSIEEAPSASQMKHKCYFTLRDLDQDLSKSIKHFSISQPRPLNASNFNVLFLACSPSLSKMKNKSYIPVWTYLLLKLRDQYLPKERHHEAASFDITEFRMSSNGEISLPYVLKTLMDEFLTFLLEESDGQDQPDSYDSLHPDNVYRAASAIIEDAQSAANLGLELISEILCNAIQKCGSAQQLERICTCFLSKGEESGVSSPIEEFLSKVDVNIDRLWDFSQKFKSVQIIVTTYRKLRELSAEEKIDFDFDGLQHKGFLKVEKLLVDTEPCIALNKKMNTHVIEQLMKDFSLLCKDQTKSLENIVKLYIRYAEEELSSSRKKGESPYALLNKQSIPIWYSSLFQWLYGAFQEYLEAAVSESSDSQSIEESLDNVNRCASMFSKLIVLTKRTDKNNIFLKPIVQNGQSFLDTMMKYSDRLQNSLDQHKDKVILIIKELQKGIKIIHIICSECKTQKNSFLASKVPALKRSVERFVWKCRQIFYDDESFWLGNLKHKDLKGQEVLSQLAIPEFDKENVDNNSDTKGSQDSLLIDQSLPLSYEL